ncbi:MAG: hypothetical protein R3C27_06885 [Hyphomonadaceae bacterium]
MKARWIILGLAGLVLVGAWSAVAITYFFLDPTIVTWGAVVTFAALATEGFFWVAAGAFGWGFLAKRRAALARFRDRFFGKRQQTSE